MRRSLPVGLVVALKKRQRIAFFAELMLQARIANKAYLELRARTGRELPTTAEGILEEAAEVWGLVQSFVHATAVMRSILSSGRVSKHSQGPDAGWSRGEELRVLLGVQLNSPLMDPVLRNDVAHVDERIDKWVAAGNGNAIESSVSLISPFGNLPPQSRASVLRWFDPKTLRLRMNDGGIYHELSLGAVNKDCQEIAEFARKYLGHPRLRHYKGNIRALAYDV